MTAPRCCWCDRKISKRTTRVYIRTVINPRYDQDSKFCRHLAVGDAWPLTKADAVRLTNQTITSVSYRKGRLYDDGEPTERHIDAFTEWDGVTYVDNFFCTGEHARFFGYAAARNQTEEQGNMTKINVGDRVAYSARFLRSIVQYTRQMPFLRGTVISVAEDVPGWRLLTVEWDRKWHRGKTNVNDGNLVLVKDIAVEAAR